MSHLDEPKSIQCYRLYVGLSPFWWQLYKISWSNPTERVFRVKVGPVHCTFVRPPLFVKLWP